MFYKIDPSLLILCPAPKAPRGIRVLQLTLCDPKMTHNLKKNWNGRINEERSTTDAEQLQYMHTYSLLR